MNNSGSIRSTSVRPSYYNQPPVRTSTIYYGDRYVPSYYYGGWSGYSYSWYHPAWYFWTPFHPAWYYDPPVYYGGAVYPGSFNWLKFFLGILIFAFVVWLIVKLFTMKKGVRYVTYR